MFVRSQFWQYYTSLVDRFYGTLIESDGVRENKIIATEKHLGLRLPQILRDFYLLTGNREDINLYHNHLITIDKLEIIENTLFFYEESQGIILWGIPIDCIKLAVPKVFYTENLDFPNW